MNEREFQAVFEALLTEVVQEGGLDSPSVDTERLKVLEGVCNGFSEVVGKGEAAKLKLHPAFRSGGVSIEVPEVNLNQMEVSRLKEVLSTCDTFEVAPLANGAVCVTATVKRVFTEN